jgi:hypothetical protein
MGASIDERRKGSRWLLAGAALLPFLSTAALAQSPQHTPPPRLQCPGDRVVWVNTKSGIYHFKGERYFGSTQTGKFMCQKTADAEGDRPTRNGQ